MKNLIYKKFTGLNNDIIKIRTSIFIEEQGFNNEFDEIDKTCSHIVLYNNPVATCRYYYKNNSYHIGRVAVSKDYCGRLCRKRLRGYSFLSKVFIV